MKTTWRVTEVHATEAGTKATLQRVSWFKAIGDPDGDDWESFDVEPGENGAEFIEDSGTLTLDISDGVEMAPGDNVVMVLDVLEFVPA